MPALEALDSGVALLVLCRDGRTVGVRTRFLLGPSGSGKTFRCLAEARAALRRSATGLPLLILAPKQATFQLERELLSDPGVAGYTRLRILSFERLAQWILTELSHSPTELLSEQGRLMVLRALLARSHNELKLFRATARLRGFAQELSAVLRELQRANITAAQLRSASDRIGSAHQLDLKLRDIAAMLALYGEWLERNGLQDADQLLSLATEAMRALGPAADGSNHPIRFEALWFDGFADLAPQELCFLVELLPCCGEATLAFNLDREAVGPSSWLQGWSMVGQTFQRLHAAVGERPAMEVSVEWLKAQGPHTRFAANAALQHLERHWWRPEPFQGAPDEVSTRIQLHACRSVEVEVTTAAREILRFVRAGGRYRQAAVIVRDLETYVDAVRRVFGDFEIPHFLDRREPVGHHPLAELTRSALRTLAFQWQPEDWFSVLKTGLAHRTEHEVDRLENEALARGWRGDTWLKPLSTPDQPDIAATLEPLREKLVGPLEQLRAELGTRPSGVQLARGLAAYWERLRVAQTLEAWSSAPGLSGRGTVAGLIHAALWEQMQEWLADLEMAFAHEALSLREWLPIIEAGLASQTVGVIPPTLDQVLVGAIDRSRNPDLKLALVLGMNESVFPAAADQPNLLSTSDREALLQAGVELSASTRRHLAQERYLGYIACTRARERLVVTFALRSAEEKALNPSPFIDQLQRLFPTLTTQIAPSWRPWDESEHRSELVASAFQSQNAGSAPELRPGLEALPGLSELRERVRAYAVQTSRHCISPALAEALYGPILETSVSRLEEYAACPFRFAMTSGLRLEPRKLFRLDPREQGTFQHEVLARFHQQLRAEGKRWRDLSGGEARQRIRQIADTLVPEYRGGLLQASGQTRFAAEGLVTSLQEFIAAAVDWMPQYQFDPHAVELAFGIEEKPLPAWEMDLGEGHRLSFRGKIDRIDLCVESQANGALCVVIDYKSSARRLDPVLVAHGVQLQLLAYLNVLSSLPSPGAVFGVKQLVPAGVFFVNLRGRYQSAAHRNEALEGARDARAAAYQHTGRFDAAALPKLDARPGVQCGDQFNFRFRKDGQLHGSCREALDTMRFTQLLQRVEGHLRRMGRDIYAGTARTDPYRKNNTTACDACEYRPVCRIDPWTHVFRVLEEENAPAIDAMASP